MRTQLRWPGCSVCLAVLLAASARAAAEVPTDGSADAGVDGRASLPEHKWFLDGRATEEYRFRYASSLATSDAVDDESILPPTPHLKSDADHDLRLYLDGYLSESTGQFAAELSMGAWVDLDGAPRNGEASSLSSIDDYEAPEAWHDPFDIYALYAEYRSDSLFDLARGGRQTAEYGWPITFDGAMVRLSPLKPYLDIAFFGGRTVHFFKLDDGLFEDWLGSAVSVIRPVPSLRIELD